MDTKKKYYRASDLPMQTYESDEEVGFNHISHTRFPSDTELSDVWISGEDAASLCSEIDRLRAELELKEKKLRWSRRREDRLYRAARTIAGQREQAEARVRELEAAVKLAKDMFIANDLELPHTFEVLDEALASSEKED